MENVSTNNDITNNVFSLAINNAPGVVLVFIGLMAMISLRNSDIATRCRNLVDEYLYKIKDLSTKQERANEIIEQHEIFIKRYVDLSRAFKCAVFGLSIYLISLFVSKWSIEISNLCLSAVGVFWLASNYLLNTTPADWK